ncbi:MAG: hypothetical protein JOS17DRAFT_778012 [Linnemannia elongata]|nr:MAG: hypothetical protein JOS17DRAFT_778012 [Linnemannia elongata]
MRPMGRVDIEEYIESWSSSPGGDHSKENGGGLSNAWGPEAAEALCEEIKDFKIPLGGTIGDLIRASPKDCIAKVLSEEKLFETWYHLRTVLMGDACHKKWYENLLRRFVLSVASKFFQRQNYAKTLNYRLQASFLERIPDRGTIPVLPQKASLRYTEEQATLRRKQREESEEGLHQVGGSSVDVVAVA